MDEYFDFYGFTTQVSSPSTELLDEVRRDFAYFRTSPPDRLPQLRAELRPTPPPYGDLPSVPAAFFTPRNVCFRADHLTYIDYFGEALAVFDRREQRCTVYATDLNLLHEIAYLFILSMVGQHLDRKRLHRVHALGLAHLNRGILILLPSGGGKSTLALDLLRKPGFLLLAEDTPLIDRRGRILPFPLRLGVRPGRDTGVPAEYLRTKPRMEFDPKTLIDLDYFHDRLAGPTASAFLLIGERNLGDVSRIIPLPKPNALKALLKYMVVGLGVYQGLEFLLERGLGDTLGQGSVVTSRLCNSLVLLARTPAYRFILGRNTERNSHALVDFLDRRHA